MKLLKLLWERAKSWLIKNTPTPAKPDALASNKQEAGFPEWVGTAKTVIGHGHLQNNPPTPCQDAAYVATAPRPMMFVADGAGSAILSHFGAQAAVKSAARLTVTLEDMYANMLDDEAIPPKEECQKQVRRIIRHVAGTLSDLASEQAHSFKDFHCTFLGVIIGRKRLLWLQVGDGAIVREADGKLSVVGPPGKAGEYANVTNFLKENPDETIHSTGLLDIKNISGMAAMTDGAMEWLVSNDCKKVATRITKFTEDMRKGKFGPIHEFMHDAEIWKIPKGRDDRGLAILSRK